MNWVWVDFQLFGHQSGESEAGQAEEGQPVPWMGGHLIWTQTKPRGLTHP